MSFNGTPTAPAIAAAVNQAIQELLPYLMENITQQLTNQGNNPPPPPPPYTPPHIPDPPPFDSETNNSDTATGIHVWLARFQKQKPRSFSSAPDHMDACNWVMHIEKIFEVLGIDDQFKVRLASYKLEDDAQSWWRGVKHAHGGDTFAATLGWNEFKEIFYRQYFETSHQERYQREYATIAQGDDEPMREFMARFTRLASFLGDAAGSPQVQANKLKWAVCERFRKLIVMTRFNTVTEVADAVQTLEMAEKMIPTGENRKRDRDDNNHTSSGNKKLQSNQNPDHKTEMQLYQSSSQGENNTKGLPTCKHCGKMHQGTCHRLTGACFQCGQIGHRAKDCMNPKSRRNGNDGETNAPRNIGGRVFALTTNETLDAPNNNA